MSYQSKYSPGKMVREDQYIIELVCEKNAKQSGRELPIQFWKLPQWSSFYRSQLRRCKALLEKYHAQSIINALKDKRCVKTYSLYGSWLEKVIVEYENKRKDTTDKTEPEIEQTEKTFIRKDFKKNIVDKLNEC